MRIGVRVGGALCTRPTLVEIVKLPRGLVRSTWPRRSSLLPLPYHGEVSK